MKIDINHFRVQAGDTVDRAKWATHVAPVYQSKKEYRSICRPALAPP